MTTKRKKTTSRNGTTSKVLTRRDLVGFKLPFEDIDCPELGGAVRVQALSAGAYKDMRGRDDPLRPMTVHHVIAACCIDENGDPLFENHHAPALNNLSHATFERLGHAALRINGFLKPDAEPAAE